jgi:phenylacetate-coenzyme A ligase PaaK-like adenylate-forming protein
MAIIGKIIKTSSKAKFHRESGVAREYKSQIRTLFKLLDFAKDTNFGLKYGFEELLVNSALVSQFQNTIPLTNYDQFYDDWLQKSIKGKRNHTWPGRIKHYALSSGTSGAPSKRIPVTNQMIKSFQKTSVNQISTLHQLDLNDKVFSSKILVVGGSSKLKKVENHYEGDLSGILKKNTSFIYNPFTKPGKKITELTNWTEKLEQMVIKAPSWDIGIIAGVPSWCLLLIEKIIEVYKVKTIHDIWPNFELYIHGGVFIEPYLNKLESVSGKKVHLLDTYLSSEGYFAFQTSPDQEGMQLLVENGIFYEFIPFTPEYFDADGNCLDTHFALTLNRVQVGVDYAMVITTNAGLWRYMIGDLVQFVNVKTYEVKISGRIQQYLSLVGEHLSLNNINVALKNINHQLGVDLLEFCIVVDEKKGRHCWYIGSNTIKDKFMYVEQLDEELMRINDDYKTCRKYNLSHPKIEILDPSVFYEFLEKIGKSGSQHKFPRVLNKVQAKKWISFLKKGNIIRG